MSDSSNRPAGGKDGRPQKPSKDFPLYAHKVGRWAKKVRGSTVYFTSWREDPKGEAALEMWLQQKEDLLAGRVPKEVDPDALTVETLCFRFLEHKERLRDSGELNPRTYRDYFDTCKSIVAAFGRPRAVTDLTPADFGKLRGRLAKRLRAVALRNEMQSVRSVFKFAYDEGLIDAPIRFGQSFVKPKVDVVRKHREAHRDQYGDRMFGAEEIRAILKACKQPLKAQVMLAANTGFGQADLSAVPLKAVDLKGGWVSFARVKTGVRRRIPLWPETVKAIREWLAVRPKAKSPQDAGLLFLTRRGCRCVTISDKGSPRDSIGLEFGRLLVKLKMKRPRLSFYGLRHGLETVGGDTGDQVAVDAIMGHTPHDMGAHYRERISDDRLRRVVDHVHDWLFPPPAEPQEAEPEEEEKPETDGGESPVRRLRVVG